MGRRVGRKAVLQRLLGVARDGEPAKASPLADDIAVLVLQVVQLFAVGLADVLQAHGSDRIKLLRQACNMRRIHPIDTDDPVVVRASPNRDGAVFALRRVGPGRQCSVVNNVLSHLDKSRKQLALDRSGGTVLLNPMFQ